MFNFFDLSLQVNGFPINKAKAELKKIQSISESEYENYVVQKRNEIVEYHLKHNSNYRSFVGLSNVSSWDSIPIQTKKNFQKPLQQRLSDGLSVKNVYVNKTSGSSGDPFFFAKDKFCHALTWAVIIDRFGWFTISFNASKQARFYGIPLDFLSNKKERLKDFLSHRHRFSIFDLSDAALEMVLIKFQKTNFQYINGYTSALVLFAKFLQKKNLVLTAVCPSLHCCIVTSEMLFEADKILMEHYFGVPIVNEYGASELDLIAFQNSENQLQVNSETLFVEILDDQNRVLPLGAQGRIVVTSLYNKAHPFIRYDLGDIGVLDEKSTIKKPLLKKLVGRTNDIVVLPSGKKAAGLTFYYITKSCIKDDGNVKEFVIKQTKKTTFEIHYVSENPLNKMQIAAIEREIATYLEAGLSLYFVKQDKLERSQSGKLKQFESLVK